MSRSLLDMKETPRNRKQKASPTVTTAEEERETPRRLKIKPRNLKEKPRRYSKGNSSSYPQVTEKLRNLKIKPNNLNEKPPSRSAQVENHLSHFPLDLTETNQVTTDKYYEYLRQLEESEGFHVEDCNLGILDDDFEAKLFPCPDGALALSAAKFALGNHNKDKGAKLSLVRVVRAMVQLVDGYNLWITLEASDHCLYEAHVYSDVYEDHCAVHSLYFFRPAKFKQRFESDINVDDLNTESYKDFTEFVNINLSGLSFDDGLKYNKYLSQLMNSECFDVDDWGLDAWAQLVKPCSDMALAKSAAVFALKKHNKEKGENLELESVVRATEHKGDKRKNLWITLKASNHGFYEAKTFSKVLNRIAVHSLDFFRPAKYYGNTNV